MIPSLSQETITEYASEAQTIQEPAGTDYTQGVRVGKTVPAKWWNWLFRGTTRRLGQAKTDAQNMLTEMQNVVTDAGITLSASDSHQMSKSVVKDADTQIDKYVEDKKNFLTRWYPITRTIGDSTIVDDTLQQLDSKHMVALFEGANNTYHICVSTNGVDWTTVSSLTGHSGYANRGGFLGVVFFNNAYYVLVSEMHSYGGQCTSILLRTVDCIDFTVMFEHTSEGDSSYRRFPVIAVAGPLLYVQESNARSAFYSEDGVNLVAFGSSSGQSTISIATSYSHNCTFKAYQLTEDKYVVFTSIINVQNKTKASAVPMPNNGYFGTTKLLNGSIAVAWSYNEGTSEAEYLTILRPDGTTSTVDSSRDNVYIRWNGSRHKTLVEGYVFKRRGTQDNTVVSYSSDGSNFTDLPRNLYPYLAVDDLIFVLNVFGHNVYQIAVNSLSADMADYELVYAGLDPAIYFVNEGAIINGRRIILGGPDDLSNFSDDYGHTWHKILSTKKPSGNVLNIESGLYTQSAFTNLTINKVSGYTLYLR